MKPNQFKFYILLVIQLFLLNLLNAQEEKQPEISPSGDTVYMRGYITRDTTWFADKIYILDYNTLITRKATLTIESGVQVWMNERSALVTEGGLKVMGEPGKMVLFKSLNPDAEALGLIIRGNEGGDIHIQYARFEKLLSPLRLEPGWYRKSIVIQDNIFYDNATGEPLILYSRTDQRRDFLNQETGTFLFTRNVFTGNWGSIFIEALEDDLVQATFNHNVITGNVMYTSQIGNPHNAIFFGAYNDESLPFRTVITENSIFGNYQINPATDSIIREVSIGIMGEGEQYAIPNNYFRSKDLRYIGSTFDDFYTNVNLPLLLPKPVLTRPSEEAHGHLYAILWNGKELKEYNHMPAVKGKTEVTLLFNRPVRAMGPKQVEFIFYDTVNQTLSSRPVAVWDTAWTDNRTAFTFSVRNADYLNNPLGYMTFSRFVDDEGFETPLFVLGQMEAINNYTRVSRYHRRSRAYIPSLDVITEAKKVELSEEAIKTLEEKVQRTIVELNAGQEKTTEPERRKEKKSRKSKKEENPPEEQ